MRFRFDANQEFQIRAVEAVADLVDGQAYVTAGFEFAEGGLGLSSIPNRLDIDESTILANLRKVQDRSGVAVDDTLRTIDLPFDGVDGPAEGRFLNFSVEMETGTGKTYVYIRTALELHRGTASASSSSWCRRSPSARAC